MNQHHRTIVTALRAIARLDDPRYAIRCLVALLHVAPATIKMAEYRRTVAALAQRGEQP